MDIFEDHYCQWPRFFLNLTGLWPTQSILRRRLILIFYITLSASVALPQALFIIRHGYENFDLVVENCGIMLFNLLGPIQFIVIYVKSSMFEDLHLEAVERWKKIIVKEEKEILARFVWIARILGIIYTVYAVGTGLTAMPLVPVICTMLDASAHIRNSTQYRFILINSDYFFFEQQDHFWFSWFHVIAGLNAEFLVFGGINSMYIIFVREICGLFNIVRFCELLENTFNLMIMLVQLTNILLLSTIYYYLAYAEVPFIKKLGAAMILVGTNAFMFCINWAGQEIIDYSHKVFDSAYASEWDEMILEDRRMLLMIMLQSSKPSILTSGGLFPMSMESFGKLTKATYTYFAAISSMR